LPAELAGNYDQVATNSLALGGDQVRQSAACFTPDESVEQIIRRRFAKDIKPKPATEHNRTGVSGHPTAGAFKGILMAQPFTLVDWKVSTLIHT
jgi:hypothetical protein